MSGVAGPTNRRYALAMAGWLCFAFAWSTTVSAAAGPSPLPLKHRFVRFGPEQGLSSVINDLAVDRQGYVWAATGDGLARYDGSRFRFWRREPGVDSSLPDNDLVALALDEDDRVWVASSGHLGVMDRTRRGFVPVRFEGEAAACGRDITAISAAVGGGVWLLRTGIRSAALHRRLPAADGASISGSAQLLLEMGSNDLLIGTKPGFPRQY
jgi:ligand-binding sensor domain-containing protein